MRTPTQVMDEIFSTLKKEINVKDFESPHLLSVHEETPQHRVLFPESRVKRHRYKATSYSII